jgi:hypothetical protein
MLPSAEAVLPQVVATAESMVPFVEQNAVPIIATTTAVGGVAVTAAETGGIGTMIASATAGVPGGPVGVAVGVGVGLVLIAGAWWYAHKDPAPKTQNVAAAETTVVSETTSVSPPGVESSVTFPSTSTTTATATTLPLFTPTSHVVETATTLPPPTPNQPPIAVSTTAKASATTTSAATGSPTSVPPQTAATSSTTAGPSQGVTVKGVSTKSCVDSGISQNDYEHHVTIDGKPIAFDNNDYTGHIVVAPGSHTVGGGASILSITISTEGHSVKETTDQTVKWDFVPKGTSTDYAVAIRFKASGC